MGADRRHLGVDARTFSEKELTGWRREAKEPEPSPQVSEG